jgi:hypothetical protein
MAVGYINVMVVVVVDLGMIIEELLVIRESAEAAVVVVKYLQLRQISMYSIFKRLQSAPSKIASLSSGFFIL